MALRPASGSLLATIRYDRSECPIEGVEPVKGKINATIPNGQLETTSQEIKINTPESELKVGGSSATLKGAASFTAGAGEVFGFILPSVLFSLTVEKTGNEGKFTVKNISAIRAKVKEIRLYETPPGEWLVNVPEMTACTKEYLIGESCSWKVTYDGIQPSTISTLLIDENSGTRFDSLSGGTP
jgi:hypothetical protein